ncbi:MAG: glycosyltransferase family 4 protein [Gammaproteobacteria bacterium]
MSKPLRTLFLVPSLGQGGAEAQLVNLANGVDAGRFKKHLVCIETQHDNLDDLDQDSVAFFHMPRRSKYDRTLITRLADFINENHIQVIHATLLLSGYIAWAAIKKSRSDCKLVIAIHSTKSRTLKTELIYRVLYMRSLKSASKLIFVSDGQRQYWLSKYPWMEAKSLTVHNGINPQDFIREAHQDEGRQLLEQHHIDASKPVISVIAAFRTEKNHDLIIKAIHNLEQDVTLCLAGGGSLQANAEQLVEELGLQERVIFLGRLNDVRPLLAVSTLTLLVSKSEAFSMAMLESLCMQVPMLASDVGGLSEAVIPGETGELIAPNDVDAITDGIARMLSNPAKLAEMGRQGRKLVEDRFTTRMMIDAISNVMEDS